MLPTELTTGWDESDYYPDSDDTQLRPDYFQHLLSIVDTLSDDKLDALNETLESVLATYTNKKRDAMAATQAQQDILNMMSRYAGNFDAARVKKNPFGTIKVPVGSYVWQLVRMALTSSQQNGKPKVPGVQFNFVCQASMEGDTEHAGEQVRVNRKIGATEKQDEQESVDRLIYDLQDLGVNTELLDTFNPNPAAGMFNILQLCSFMTTSGLYVRGDITESKPDAKGVVYKNLNVKARLSDEELEAILGPGNYTPSGTGEGELDADELSNTEITDTTDPDYDEADYADVEGEDGGYVDEDGNPCDEHGNPVGTVYADVPVEAPVPVAPAPQAKARTAPVQKPAAPAVSRQTAVAAPRQTGTAPAAVTGNVRQAGAAPAKAVPGTGPKRVGPPKRA